MTLALSGCSSQTSFFSSDSNRVARSNDAQRTDEAQWLQFAEQGVNFLDDGYDGRASSSFNDALKFNIRNAKLQALNGIAYHLNGRNRDASQFKLASEGYKLASKFDPSDWRIYYLRGLMHHEQRNYVRAKNYFIKAAARNPGNLKIFYRLLASAYYSFDLELAQKVADYLLTTEIPLEYRAETNKSCALINAAIGDSDFYARKRAQQCLASYTKLVEPAASRHIRGRMATWSRLNRAAVKIADDALLLAQAQEEAEEAEEAEEEGEEGEEGEEEEAAGIDERMVIVDVVIIGSIQDERYSSGINILNGLQFQFGDVANSVNAFSKNRSRVRDTAPEAAEANNEFVTTIIKQLTIPAISYSLNIVNSETQQNKILAKPSLMALSGQKSEFFSGSSITGAATAGGSGESVSIEKEIGVKLTVSPEFIDDNRVLMVIAAERTFLTDPSSSVVFDYRLDTSKTTVSSTVVMNLGQTLVLGGLVEQAESLGLDGVPYLRDVPFLKLFFSEQSDRKFKKSVTILLTPRAVEPATPKKGEEVPDKETVPQNSGAKQKMPQNPDFIMLRQLLEENIRNNKVLGAAYRKGIKSNAEIIWKILYQKFGRQIRGAGDKFLAARYKRGLDAYTAGDYVNALREWEPLAKQGVAKNSLTTDFGRRYLGAMDINYQIRNTEIVEVAKSLYKDLDTSDED